MLKNEGAVSEDRIAELKSAGKYKAWQLSQFFPANIRFLWQQLDSAS